MKTGKIVTFLSAAFLLAVSFRIGAIYGADDRSPGSGGDPLITKSYLDERLKHFSGGGKAGFRKVTVRKGESILFETGSLLVIGEGNGIVKGREGLINTGKGILFREGDSAVKYNIFLAPAEKCGIIATDKLTVFVSGGWNIQSEHR